MAQGCLSNSALRRPGRHSAVPDRLARSGQGRRPLRKVSRRHVGHGYSGNLIGHGHTRRLARCTTGKPYVRAAPEHQATGPALPRAIRRMVDDAIVGSTRFLDLEVLSWPPPWPPRVGRGPEPNPDRPPSVAEIGSTWYVAFAQRSGVNTEVKWLQLTHAFEVWNVLRVTLKTDARNMPSRRAIERLGACFEGVRRAHVPASDGTVRDTAYYSIISEEWPASPPGCAIALLNNPVDSKF